MNDQINEAANEEQGADEPVDPQAAANRAAANEAGEGEPGDMQAEPDPFQVLVALQKENAELKDKALRAVAEAENTRRRAERERQDAVRYAAAGFARDMVQVSDNLRRAIAALKPEEREASPDTVKALIDGVEATERQLLATFERHGIKEITPAPGDRFDAHLHEAMFEVPNSGQPAGSVVHVIEAGYMIGDRLLRAARVGVAKGEDGAPKPNGAGVDVRA
ncbi:MAG: nucleotide exchange factor GrpE [Parvibaculum sp.]|uniref:nucleotide exchange factor GrpE n=1 Tax=Parvibaculum sp. TaxID=2024848 RepID=UPI0025F1189F|nr:nucleotide exchange factor GrpE [Parvibaculum sp.]MCE9648121.1 nucleotide exchange factor GrpE [Parvibaculum sp.]